MPIRSAILVILLFLAAESRAQTIRLQFSDTPVPEALAEYSEVSGVDVVYSPALVSDLRTSCRYRGTSARDALICIMSGHPFRVESISRRQTVLIPLNEERRTESRSNTDVLSGFVVDNASGEALHGAHVILPGVGAGAITNEAGFFSFPGLGSKPVSMVITYLGFARLDTTIVATGRNGRFALSPMTYEVSGVVIEEDVERRADLTITPGLISVTSHQLQQLPGTLGNTDVLESLKWLPGVQRAGEATGGLLVRGSGPDQNLYLVDGAPIYHPWHAFSLVSTFQSDTFKDVSLYRGAFPAEYGGRLSAVLDAELRDGSQAEPSAKIGVSGLNASFILESPVTPNSSFMLSGRRSYVDRLIGRTHPVEDDMGRQDTLRTGYYFYDWSAKFTFRPDPLSTVSMSWYAGRDALDLRLPFDLSLDFASWLRPADLFFEIDQAWGNRILSTRYQRLISSRLFLSTTVFFSQYRARENTFIRPSQTSAVTSDYRVELEDVGARVALDWYPSLQHQVRVGVESVRHRFVSNLDATVAYTPTLSEPLAQDSQTHTTEASAFIQDIWSPAPSLKVLPGMRASVFGKGGYVRLEPRLSVQWAVDPTWLILRVAASSHIQYLQRIRDRNAFLYDLVSSRWVPVGSGAEPARAKQVSVGVESHVLPRTILRLNGFLRSGKGTLLPEDEFQSKDGLLGPGIDVATLLGQYQDGEERSTGLESGVEIRSERWTIIGSYTYMETGNRPLDEHPGPWRPSRYDIPHAFTLVVNREAGRWETGASLDWRSGYPVSVPTARYQLEDPVTGEPSWYFHRAELNNGRLPAYFRLDVRAAYRFDWAQAGWSTGITVYNAINHRNVIGQTWDPSKAGARADNRLGLPILPMLDILVDL